MVVIFLVVSIELEDIVADSNSVELMPNTEVRAQSALHCHLMTSNMKTGGDRDIVDDVLERAIVFNGGKRAGP